MTATSAATHDFDTAGFEAFLAARQEPQWLTDLRRESFDHFETMSWPDRRSEEWIRSDLRLFQLKKYHVPVTPTETPVSPGYLSHGVELGGYVRSVDSHVRQQHLDEALAARGVICMSLDEAATKHPELVRENLFTAVDPDYDRFAALHAAFWSGGQFVYIPRGVVVDQPLHLVTQLGEGQTDLSHTLIVLEEGAEVTVLHEAGSVDRDAGGASIGGVEIRQHPSSHLRYVSLQEQGYKTFQFAHQRAIVDREASLQWTLGAMGNGFAKVNQSVALVGPDADSQVNGVLFTEGRQHIAYHTLQHHVAPHCHSDFLYKSAQQDQSRTVWRGMIKVDKGAQKTDGYQRNDNLVLSDRARADSIPGLEIEADDVRCTHGSTTARVDDEQIYYAQCRGFTRNEAVRMIVTGFFQQIFDRISIESVRNALGETIAKQVREYV
jgi:Fe-S cluster assembly protein SufD